MKQCNKTRRAYVAPSTHVIATEVSSIICASPSVIPDAGNSTGGSGSSSWNPDETHDGGTIFFGDETTVAPSKKGVWEDEY